MLLLCIKQHLNNIWSSIHQKVKQLVAGWVEKKVLLTKKSVFVDIILSVIMDDCFVFFLKKR